MSTTVKLSTLDIERHILTCIIMEDDTLWSRQRIRQLQDKYFSNQDYKRLFHLVKTLNEKNISGLINLERSITSEEYQQFTDLIESTPTTATLDESIRILKEKWVINQFTEKAREFALALRQSITIAGDIDSFICKVKDIQSEISQPLRTNQNEVITRTLQGIENKDKSQIVSYCMPKVKDSAILFRGQVHVIGATSGLGKTAWCLSCMQHQYAQNINTVYFCCESTSEELFQRLCCQVSTKSYLDFAKGFPYGGEENFKQSIEWFKQFPERITFMGKENYANTIEDIDNLLYKISHEKRIDMVYIDYLQSIKILNASKYQKDFERVAEVIKTIGDYAVKYNCAITTISQFNRREKDEDNKPTLLNLRGASDIENVAHIISFLHIDKKEHENTEQRVKDVWFYSGKTRLIKPFRLKLAYDSYCGLFHDKMEPIPFPYQIPNP